MTFEPVHWTEWLRAIGPALIAAFVAYIAYQQWQTNRASVREKLFDRRLGIFESVEEFFSLFLRDGQCNEESVSKILSAPSAARFLFPGPLAEYLDEVKIKALKAQRYNLRVHDAKDTAERNKWIDREEEINSWLHGEAQTYRARFRQYIEFDKY